MRNCVVRRHLQNPNSQTSSLCPSSMKIFRKYETMQSLGKMFRKYKMFRFLGNMMKLGIYLGQSDEINVSDSLLK